MKLSQRGKVMRSKPLQGCRELTREDLQRLPEKRTDLTSPQRIRNSHHRIARLAATGLRNSQIAEECGYTSSRVSQLLASPAMQQLVAELQREVTQSFRESVDEFHSLAVANMRQAELQIADLLGEAAEEGAEAIPLRTLDAIASSRMDRFGYSRQQTNLNVNVDFAAQLEKTIARSGKIIDHPKAQRVVTPPLVEPEVAPAAGTDNVLSQPTPQAQPRLLRRA